MSDYAKSITFEDKDNLPTGDPNKRILGSEVDSELDQIGSVTATKANKVPSPVTGNVAEIDGNGDLVDSGFSFTGLTGAVTATQAEINKLTGLATSAIELGYVSGVTSAIQTQLNARLVAASNLSDLASAATARNNLGLGSLAIQNTINASDIDNDAVTAAKAVTGMAGGCWASPNSDVEYTDTSWTTQETMYLFIPSGATTLNYKFEVTANANGVNFRLSHSGANGTTTTNSSASKSWDIENETLDVSSVDGTLVAINVQSYSNAGVGTSHKIHQVAWWIE